jgi:hypothetical protein
VRHPHAKGAALGSNLRSALCGKRHGRPSPGPPPSATVYVGPVSIEIRQVTQERLGIVATILGRAFVTEPMMSWPLGRSGDLTARFTKSFELFSLASGGGGIRTLDTP